VVGTFAGNASHAGLAGAPEVVAIGLLKPYWIGAVTANIAVNAGMTLDQHTVIKDCRERSGHLQAPKRIIFVDHLPKTASVEVLKGDLLIQYFR
jgi:acyl-CoA synthetase (AMP-forming)/AMP-acid ligase II